MIVGAAGHGRRYVRGLKTRRQAKRRCRADDGPKGVKYDKGRFLAAGVKVPTSSSQKSVYRVAENGEWVRITESGEQRTGFFYVRGGRTAP
jgi:hypothetical protein